MSFAQSYVDRTIWVCNNPQKKGLASTLRRCDNPSNESGSWEYLAGFNIDISKSYIRRPYSFVAAAIAKSKTDKNGTMSIGKAMRAAGKDNLDAMATRFRRLLACNDTDELMRVLRSTLTLIDSRLGSNSLDFVKLLNELTYFNREESREHTKSGWARDFYLEDHVEENGA